MSRTTKPIGVTVPKKISAIAMGLTILWRSRPISNHSRLRGRSIHGANRANPRKTDAGVNAHQRTSFPRRSGARAMTVKNPANTKPNERSDDPRPRSSRIEVSWLSPDLARPPTFTSSRRRPEHPPACAPMEMPSSTIVCSRCFPGPSTRPRLPLFRHPILMRLSAVSLSPPRGSAQLPLNTWTHRSCDPRRNDASPIRQRRAGGKSVGLRLAPDFDWGAADRRQQRLGRVLPRADR
jgi:hypothetical protein